MYVFSVFLAKNFFVDVHIGIAVRDVYTYVYKCKQEAQLRHRERERAHLTSHSYGAKGILMLNRFGVDYECDR